MSDIKPYLVTDRDTGKLCMQLRLGVYTATHELPEQMAGWKFTELQAYFDEVVPDMLAELKRMRRDDLMKLQRKLK